MENLRRTLAAIMFTDIVGYSALSHRNETLALALLEESRALCRPLFARFSGTEIKTIGDAFLVRFDSALDAVQCGIEVQRVLRERNLTQSHERRIVIRIGIHLGDVVIAGMGEKTDVYGDGVNIAARLQYVALPGCICISESVYQQVVGKLARRPTFIGLRKLKNISTPMRLYGIGDGSSSLRSPARKMLRATRKSLVRYRFQTVYPVALGIVAALVALSWPKTTHVPEVSFERVAVLPLRNLTNEANDEWLSDGVTEELITDLSRVGSVRVVASASVMQYKSKTEKPIPEIAQELHVGTIIQGSVRRQGDQLRVNVQIIDARTQENLWSQGFDGSVSNVFEVQKSIADRLAGQFRSRGLASVASAGPLDHSVVPVKLTEPNREAYLRYLRGRYFLNRRTEESLERGIEQLESAIALDPNFAAAYAALSNALGLQAFYGMRSPAEAEPEVRRYARRALEIDPSVTDALISLAASEAYQGRDWVGAERLFRSAVAGNPLHPTAHQWYAEFLAHRGRFDEAKAQTKMALEIDPLSLVANTAAGMVEYLAGHHEAAQKHFATALEMDQNYMLAHYWSGMDHLSAGRVSDGIRQLEAADRLSGGAPRARAGLAYAYGLAGYPDRAAPLLASLLSKSRTRYVSSFDLALVEAGLGHRDEMYRFLHKAIDEKSSQVAPLRVHPAFASFRNDAEFATVLHEAAD